MPEAEAYKINNRQSLFSRVEDFVPLIDIVGIFLTVDFKFDNEITVALLVDEDPPICCYVRLFSVTSDPAAVIPVSQTIVFGPLLGWS